jgi:lysozyme
MHPKATSQTGVNLIKSFEGLHKVAEDGMVHSYRCVAGKWTIGYGSTKGVRSGMRITKEEAEARLREDLKWCEDTVKRNVEVPLTQNQFDALVSLIFNIGGPNFQSSTLLKKLNKGLYAEVPEQMMRWNKARVEGELTVVRGLTRRRTAEAALFSMDAELASNGGDPLPQKVSQTATKPLTRSKTLAGAGIAGAATVAGEVSSQLEGLVAYSENLKLIFLVVAIAGIALSAYARIKDHNEGDR